MKKLFDEFRKLEGNVLCIEINDDKVMSKLNKNDKISIYELYRNKKQGLFKKRKRIKTKGGKSVNIKKFRKIFKKKSIEYIVINIDNIFDYYKFLVSNSIYICNTKVLVYGTSEYIDADVIAKKFKRYDVQITNFKEDDQFNGNVVFKGIVDCANECLKEGITVGLGTDTGCPYITHYDMWREIYYFTKYCNVSNNFALHTATEVNAKVLGMENEIGRIKENMSADMIVTDKNPLDDIKVLRNVNMVVIRGKIINSPKIKKYKNVEEALDTLL